MISVIESTEVLTRLGSRLRTARLAANQSMLIFSQRIGVSVPTLRAMELGAPTVQVGHWMNALWALHRLDEVGALFAPRGDLIARALRATATPRQRARRRSVVKA